MTNPTPTQKSREALQADEFQLLVADFEEWAKTVGIPVSKNGLFSNCYKDMESYYAWLGFRAAWKARQSAHQSGREEERARCIKELRGLAEESYSENTDGYLKLNAAIERIQGSK